MWMTVGPYRYRVVVMWDLRDPRTDRPVRGLACYAEREIRIDAGVDLDQREDVLYHEVRHCWEFHFPRAGTDEEEAQFTAAIVRQLRHDLDEQGGLAALAALVPNGPGPDDVANLATSEPILCQNVVCPRCATVIAGWSVRSRQRPHPLGGLLVDREAYCEHCDAVIRWSESCDYRGVPTGASTAAEFDRDGVAAWLAVNAAS